jgi:hypothetical protein
MLRTTNRITLDEAGELLTSGARACLAFVVEGSPRIEPVIARHQDDRFLAGLDPGVVLPPDAVEAVLVVDDGVQFFDLRAVYVRGTPAPIDDGEGRTWYEVLPKKVTCWDYATLRIIDD